MDRTGNTDIRSDFRTRKLTTDDLDQYNALLRYAFQVTEMDLKKAGWKDDEFIQSKFPILERADVLGCYDGEQLVSQVAVYPIEMNIYGRIAPIGCVTSVSTYPEYSGRGIMSRLLYQSLHDMRERGQAMAILFPFSIPLYRRFGWEIISNKISYIIKDNQIPNRKKSAKGYVRRVDWDDEDFMELHMEFAKQTHGCLLRNAAAWDEYWRWESEDTMVAVYYNAFDKPLGYMVYMISEDVMHIKEMIYLNREAHNGLWEYIRAHYSMIDEVRGNTYYNEPIAFDLEDGDIKEGIRPYIMGRIVDVRTFFSHYHCDPTEEDSLITFDVEDDFLEWNNGEFTVSFSKGTCTVVDGPGDFRVSLGIGTLTTLLMGYKTAAQLHRMERIKGDILSIQAIDETLLHETPYISDYI